MSVRVRPARQRPSVRSVWPVRLVRRQGVTLVVGGPLPRGSAAMTLGPLVFIRRGHETSERLVRHELVHVRQYREQGVAPFLLGYLGRYLLLRLDGWPHEAAYRRLPAEIEACWETHRP